MPLVSITEGRIGFGENILIDGIAASIHPGQRIGLVGPNGSGKTSLLRAICGLLPVDRGRLSVKRDLSLGILEQTTDDEDADGRTVWEEMELAMREVDELALRIDELSEKLARDDQTAEEKSALVGKLGGAEHRFSLLGGYRRDHEIERVLSGLGFGGAQFGQRLSTLSGGQRQKAGLARLLLSRPELLVLDEPNNHLDLDGRRFLEDFLKSSPCAVLVVSHDRYFLNAVAQYIWEIDAERLFTYRGNYDAYIRQRLERIERRREEYAAQREHIARTEEYIRRNIAGQNTRQARGRRKHLARLARIEGVREAKTLRLNLAPASRTGEGVLRAENLTHGYGEKPLFDDLSFPAYRGEKIGIIGPNGCGKTTLLNILARNMKPQKGRVVYGAQVERAYLSQETGAADPARTVLDEFSRVAGSLDHPGCRSFLARFLFTGDEVIKKTGNLSGGEIRRLELAKILFAKPNFLLLDEPTNHFDIASCEMLEAALSDFPGAVIMASHDRALLDAVCGKIIAFTGEGLFICEGNYSEWLEAYKGASPETKVERLADAETSAYPADNARADSETEKPKPQRRSALFDQKRKSEKIQKKIAAVEADILELEEELAELLSDLEKPEVARDRARLSEISARMEELGRLIDERYAEIARLDEYLGAVGAED